MSNIISMIHIIPFLLCFFITSPIILQLRQPTLLSWVFQNRTQTLFIYNIKTQSILISQKIVQYPADYKKDQVTVTTSIENVTVYRPKMINHQITIQYIYYTGFNQTVQGALTASVYQQPNTAPHETKNEQFSSENLFSLRANFDKKNMDYFSKIYLKSDYDFHTYQLPSSFFSAEPKCSSFLVFSAETLRKMPQGCYIMTAKDIVQMNIYSNKYIADHKQKKTGLEIVFIGAGVTGTFFLNRALAGQDIKLLPLSSISSNLSKLALTAKNQNRNKSVLNISLTNTASELLYFQITCYQGNQTIFNSKILLLGDDSKQITTNLSTFLPTADIMVKIVNPISGEVNQIKLANFYQKKIEPTSSINDLPEPPAQIQYSQPIQTPTYIIVLAVIGGFFAILLVSIGIGLVIHRLKSNSGSLPKGKEKVFSEAENIKSLNIVDPSERINENRAQAQAYITTNDIVAFQDCQVIQKKQGTSTTLDSQNRQMRNQEEDINDHASIQDNLEIREQIGQTQIDSQLDHQEKYSYKKFHTIAERASILRDDRYNSQSDQHVIEYPDERLENVQI